MWRRTWCTVGGSIALATGSALRYPGGTARDPTRLHYSLSQNFLSDLGMTVAYDHAPNRLGATLFVASLLLLVAGLGTCLVSIVRTLLNDAGARRWARMAGVFAALACAGFTGVAVTPENRVMPIHAGFTRWAWRMVPLAAAFLALASRQSKMFRGRVAITWAIAAIALAGYVAVMVWGPRVSEPHGLVVQVIAQKAATVALIAAFLIVVRDTETILHARA